MKFQIKSTLVLLFAYLCYCAGVCSHFKIIINKALLNILMHRSVFLLLWYHKNVVWFLPVVYRHLIA